MRVRVVVALAGLLLTAAPAVASTPTPQEAQRDFAAGNERALKGDWKAAAGLYRSLLERGLRHEDLHYNLGVAEHALGYEVAAVVQFERALRLAPDHAQAQANLQAIRARLSKARAEASLDEPTIALADVARPMVRPFPRAPLAWALLGMEALFFGAWFALRRSRRAARAWLALTLAGLVGTALLGTVVSAQAVVYADRLGVAAQPGKLRQGPDERFSETGPVPAGARLRLLGEDGAWVEVQQPDGTAGWLKASDVIRI